MIQLFLVQLFGHLVGDFYLQCECMCASKREKGWRSPWLYAHMAIVFLVAWCVSWSLGFWWGALLIAVLHGLTDGIKASLQKRGCSAHALFWGDQVVHVLVIALVVWLYSSYCGWMEWEWLSGYRAAMILGLTFSLWPANFFIGDFLTMIKVEKSRSEVAAQKATLDASRVIGSIERVLVFLFVWLGQYSAIGFLIAAKSVMRFPEMGKEGNNAEYYLVGSLLSFGLSIVMAASIIILHGKGLL